MTSPALVVPADLAAISGPIPGGISFRCVDGRASIDVEQCCHGDGSYWCDHSPGGDVGVFEELDF